jgi:hypothetical protein
MNFIEKIFLKKTDKSVHLQFQKFSKGIFKDRAIINARKSGKKYTIVTSYEFANEMIRDVAGKLGQEKAPVSGAIVSTHDLTGKIDFTDKKQFQGVKRYLIDKEMSGEEIIKVLDEFPKAFFGLSFGFGETNLKIKAKAPKSGKPKNSSDESVKADFCRLTTTNEELGKGFIFERPDFKTAGVKHTYIIDKIEVPGELKNSDDFALIREESKRKGKIVREAIIDGEHIKKEIELEA